MKDLSISLYDEAGKGINSSESEIGARLAASKKT
jgi:hypothetical protein